MRTETSCNYDEILSIQRRPDWQSSGSICANYDPLGTTYWLSAEVTNKLTLLELDNSRRHSFVIGRLRTVVVVFTSLFFCRFACVVTVQLVFTAAERTNSSWLVNTSKTRAYGHWPLGKFSSISKTTSPTLRFSFGSFHVFLSWRVGRYSLIHLFQNRGAN